MAIRVAGCARDGVVVAGDVVDAVRIRVAGCARDSVVVAAVVVVDAAVVTQEVELIQINIILATYIQPIAIAIRKCAMHLPKPRLPCLRCCR
mgnify:CR=1 FL=1